MQTTYLAAMKRGLPGMLADLNRSKHVESMASGEASAEIPFGAVVARGAAVTSGGSDCKVILPVDANSVLLGVALFSNSYAPTYDIGDTGIKPTVPVSVLIEGMVYLCPEAAVTKDMPLYVRHTANGGLTTKGAVRGDANTGCILWRVGRWLEAGAAGDALKVELKVVLATAVAGFELPE